MEKIWTRGEIENMLKTSDAAVERGIIRLWKNQTTDEQRSQDVRHNNGIGFAAWSARSGTYFANWINSGRHLTGRHLERARKITLFHAGQLTEAANQKN